jgi:hypothetical protein
MGLADFHLFDGTARRIAAVCSLVAGAVAAFWLIQLLRGQVPAPSGLVKFFIVQASLVAWAFGQVAARPEVRRWIVILLTSFSIGLVFYAKTFVFKTGLRVEPHFGPAEVVTLAVAMGLCFASIVVAARQRRIDAKSGANVGAA